ncbi:serine/threonine protein kinase [Actinomadura namibiensis]|uniref:Serine/threonine protein kinase n=1 Tax=Actinomadura namibiensis TaxID=182080 RepID=A0A7W3QSA9_ACTNM|nr:serine/threonine protein kinase [Actinomadura namibiensis]MBA8957659.1 serine/threonine protein kinase [Actinomadura namibiensis]
MADSQGAAGGRAAPNPLGPGDPERLGGYVLLGRLGTGGQGVVFLGRPADGGPLVAIKLLHAQLLGEQNARARFVRELALLRRVAGRGFCTAQMLEADMEGDQPYIVSEYVTGPSLRDLVCRDGPREGADLDRLAIGTVTALTAIHGAGIVHRDFKPQNVLMGPDGPRVIDFGIARALDAGSTVTSQIVGTPAYMAPEQFTGTVVGPAADMFAWAATLLFAATGRDPFVGGPLPAVMYRIMHDQPDLSPLPPRIAEIAQACLAKDPGGRPTAEETLLWLLGDGSGAQQRAAAARPPTGAVPPARPPSEGERAPADPRTVDPVSGAGPTPFVGPPPGFSPPPDDAWGETVPRGPGTPPVDPPVDPWDVTRPGGPPAAPARDGPPQVPTGHLGHRPETAPARTRGEPHPTLRRPQEIPTPRRPQPYLPPQARRPAPETGTEPLPGAERRPAPASRRLRRGPVLVLGLLAAGTAAAFDITGLAIVLARPDLTPYASLALFPVYAIALVALVMISLIGVVLGLLGRRAAVWTVLVARVARVVLLGGWSVLATVRTWELAVHASVAAVVVLLLAWALYAPARRRSAEAGRG